MCGLPLWLLRHDWEAFLSNIPPGETGERATSLPEPTPSIQRRSDRRQGRPKAVHRSVAETLDGIGSGGAMRYPGSGGFDREKNLGSCGVGAEHRG